MKLGKAAKAITSAAGLVSKYRGRLHELCDSATMRKMPRHPSDPLRESANEEIV